MKEHVKAAETFTREDVTPERGASSASAPRSSPTRSSSIEDLVKNAAPEAP